MGEAAPGAEAELDDEQGMLAAALDAISCLVTESLSTTLFPLKWQRVRDRLNRLHAGLADVTLATADEGSEAFEGLLRGVAETARAGRALVPRSQGRSYGGGKLRLRSDLDVLAASLDAHAARLDEAHESGALSRARALVVARPGPGASRDDLRFYARHLLARLRAGGEVRREAAAALGDAVRGDEKLARAVAAELLAGGGSGVGVLVSMLECPDASVQEEAVDAVSAISGLEDAHRADLVVAGVVGPVVRVLAAGDASRLARARAARALCRLTENSDNAWAVAAHGGVTALLDACGADTDASTSELACRALRNLAGVDEIRRYMASDAGAVPVLVALARAPDDAARVHATELLAFMSAADGSVRDAVVRSGLVESLVDALLLAPASSSMSREAALRAIDAFCLSPPAATDRLLAAGFLPRVLALLRDDTNAALQHGALKAARRLSQVSEETKKAMGDAGLAPELVGVVARAKSPEARETAAEALAAVASVHRCRKRFAQEDRAVVGEVLRMLPPDEEKPSPTTRFLLATLAHLADSSSGRRKIVASEHFRNLEKLAEANVPDAKRIVKKLGGSKLRTIFHGIWSL